MERKLENYIHFYLGQEAEGFWTEEDGSNPQSEGIGKIINVGLIEMRPPLPVVLRLPIRKHSNNYVDRHFAFHQVKPLLRLISDMTEEELKDVLSIMECGSWTINRQLHRREKAGIDGTEFTQWYYIENLNERIVANLSAGENGLSIYEVNNYYRNYLQAIPFLLSKSFDLFSLIPAGLALDKTKRLSESKEGER